MGWTSKASFFSGEGHFLFASVQSSSEGEIEFWQYFCLILVFDHV
jgi:hypothetical protein